MTWSLVKRNKVGGWFVGVEFVCCGKCDWGEVFGVDEMISEKSSTVVQMILLVQ